MKRAIGMALLLVALPRAQSVTNVHVSFGNVAKSDCHAPPCDDYIITMADVVASFVNFTEGSTAVTSLDYYGAWWKDNVDVDRKVPADFCDTPHPGSGQKPTSHNYDGVEVEAGDGEWTITSRSAPNHDCEDYCTAAGGRTPPIIGTEFHNEYAKMYSLSPSSKSRRDISNEVGYAVNGVVIFSPFTFPGTVAAYDETLDTCNGHPADGKYHYHGFSPCLHNESGTDSIEHSKIYGWAFDGFPIYGPFGYADGSDPTSAVVRIVGGYACTTAAGPACSTDAEKAVPSNWAYSSSNGLLDDCNGRWTKTPEFPDGMYIYVLNVQPNGKPDFPGVPYCTQSERKSMRGPGGR